jgi:hypothetical protein
MQNRSMRVTLCFFLCVVITLFLNGCSQGRAFSTTYHAHFFGLYKPKARKPATPQGAFATGFRGIHDPFSKHSRKHNYKLDGDGFHSVVRSKRHYNTMGRPANGRKKNNFLQRKTKHRRSHASEDKKIFGKYQRKAKKNHGKH